MPGKPDSILVLGAGELGTAVLHALAHHPLLDHATLAVLKRKKTYGGVSPLQDVPCNVELICADIVTLEENELSRIFKRFHTVIACNGMLLPHNIQIKLARAILDARIKRYFPWQFGLDYDAIGPDSSQDLFTTQLQVREILRAQSEVPWTIVSTGLFTSFLFEPAFGLVSADWTSVTAIGSWDNAITVTSPTDIGRVVAELALAHPDQVGVVFVAGDSVSMRRLVEIVTTSTEHDVEQQLKTVEQLKEELAADPNDGMKKYRVVFAEAVGVKWDKSVTFNEQIGMDMETADQWAHAHRPASRSA